MGADAHHVHSAVLDDDRNDERSNVTAAREAPPLWLTLAQLAGIAAVIAILIGTFLPFTMGISRQDAAPDAIRVGDTIPRFSASDDRGERFDSERLRGQPVLIKFFRAHW